MAQSSVTHTSKKTIIPNFKLDLSKCKQDEEFGVGEEDFSSELHLSSIMLKDKMSSSNLTSVSKDDLDNMNILVARDSYRQLGEEKQKEIMAKMKNS